MMAKEPEARFGTPAEVADALAPFVDRHRSPPVRAPKPLHQHTEPAPYSPQRREASLGGIGLVIGVCVVVLFLVVGGLGAYFVLMTDDGTRLGSARPTPEKSSFYSSASDLKALVERCKPETGLTIKSITGPWGSSGGRGRDLRHDRGILCTVDGDWKAVAGFLLSLKEELERTARANGAVINAIPQGRRNGDLTSFKLEYSMGDAHGRVEANIENTPANPDIAQLDNARIRITIEEWVRPSTR
jgi:hypothetical protein